MFILRQELQISPVGIVHQQRHPEAAAYRRNASDIRPVAQIIRRGQIDRHIRSFFQFFFQYFRSHHAGQQVLSRSGQEPVHLQIQQRRGSHQGAVGIPAGQQPRKGSPFSAGGQQGQIQHGPDAQGGPLRGIDRSGSSEELRGVFSLSPDNPRVRGTARPPPRISVRSSASGP